ncbi:hypothetical protein FI667_g3906, partial [Globisporangium splendens]
MPTDKTHAGDRKRNNVQTPLWVIWISSQGDTHCCTPYLSHDLILSWSRRFVDQSYVGIFGIFEASHWGNGGWVGLASAGVEYSDSNSIQWKRHLLPLSLSLSVSSVARGRVEGSCAGGVAVDSGERGQEASGAVAHARVPIASNDGNREVRDPALLGAPARSQQQQSHSAENAYPASHPHAKQQQQPTFDSGRGKRRAESASGNGGENHRQRHRDSVRFAV